MQTPFYSEKIFDLPKPPIFPALILESFPDPQFTKAMLSDQPGIVSSYIAFVCCFECFVIWPVKTLTRAIIFLLTISYRTTHYLSPPINKARLRYYSLPANSTTTVVSCPKIISCVRELRHPSKYSSRLLPENALNHQRVIIFS